MKETKIHSHICRYRDLKVNLNTDTGMNVQVLQTEEDSYWFINKTNIY